MRDTISLPAPHAIGLFDQLLDRIRAWFGEAKSTERELADLTDEQLADLGIEPRVVRRHVRIEPDRLGLLDLGWQTPRPRRRGP